jgi:hypothetical protein
MNVEVRALTPRDQATLLEFAAAGTAVLTLDEVWSHSSSGPDQVAAGEHLLHQLSSLPKGIYEVSKILARERVELNESWPQHSLRTQMPEEVLWALDPMIVGYGGLGETALSVMDLLPEVIAEELSLLEAKLKAKREGKDSGEDMRFRTIALIGLAVGCAAIAVVTGGAAGGVAGAWIATSGLCIAAFGAAAAALVMAGAESIKASRPVLIPTRGRGRFTKRR